MTDERCNGCGACCDPVVLPFTQDEARTRPIDPADLRFILADLEPMRRKEGARRTVWLAELEAERGAPWQGLDGSPLRFYYRCRHFDETARRCTNYEGRPPMCRRYPVPEGAPVPANYALPPECGYRTE